MPAWTSESGLLEGEVTSNATPCRGFAARQRLGLMIGASTLGREDFFAGPGAWLKGGEEAPASRAGSLLRTEAHIPRKVGGRHAIQSRLENTTRLPIL
jgi:hypothetical protein